MVTVTTKGHYDRLAPPYDETIECDTTAHHRPAAELLPLLGAERSFVLDVSCGTRLGAQALSRATWT